MNKIALFDMDGTLCDYEGQLRSDLDATLSDNESIPADLWEADKMPGIKNRIDLIRRQPGWWANLPRLQWGWDVLEIARQIGFQCEILTKGPSSNPQAWAEKVEWVRRELGADMPVHVVSNKGLVYGRVLVDDYWQYMNAWLEFRPPGLGVVPYDRSAHNRAANLVSHNVDA